VRVWRICAEHHVLNGLHGTGGLYVSGRWHHRGQPVVYTSATPALAALEVLAHLDPALAPANLRLVEIAIPDQIQIETCNPSLLTEAWNVFPAPQTLQDFGSSWLSARRTAVMRVPSALLAVENNYLINPLHLDAASITMIRDIPFSFDLRLL
jgi:RES domain-containing protein